MDRKKSNEKTSPGDDELSRLQTPFLITTNLIESVDKSIDQPINLTNEDARRQTNRSDQSTNLIDQPIDPPTHQSTDQLINQSIINRSITYQHKNDKKKKGKEKNFVSPTSLPPHLFFLGPAPPASTPAPSNTELDRDKSRT